MINIVIINSSPCGLQTLSQWTVPANIQLTQGSSFDLKPTLPEGVTAGGAFSIFSGGLPAGWTLSADGVLAVAVDAPVNQSSTVQFLYKV